MNVNEALKFLIGPAEEKIAQRAKEIADAHDDFMVKKSIYDNQVAKYKMADHDLPITKFNRMVDEETIIFKRDYKDAEIMLKRSREKYEQLLDYINLLKIIVRAEEDSIKLQSRK